MYGATVDCKSGNGVKNEDGDGAGFLKNGGEIGVKEGKEVPMRVSDVFGACGIHFLQ